MAETNWLQLAKDAHQSSTSYVDANYRKKWEDGLRMFQSRHPQDSKYLSDAYKHRSKIFRPKSRSLVRKHEAAAAAAFFSNLDVISTAAVNQNDRNQAASADLWKEVINYRLTKTIPWFLTLVGAMQDCMTVGVACSYQYWRYEAKSVMEYETMTDEFGNPFIGADGQPMLVERPRMVVKKDQPCIELMPVENIRIDPGASWINPIESSPYVIRLVPMYVCDVKAMMNNLDQKTNAPKWKTLTDGQIKSAMKNDNDSTAQTREQNRQDSKDPGNTAIGDYEIVWVHENFMRVDGEEMVFYTLGTEFMLTDAKPLAEVYFTGDRPIVMGCCVVETHKVMPDSPVMLGEQLQREANEVVNQRLDNVKLVLNKRYIVKRGAQVDIKSLVRNVPGSVTLANDVQNDVNALEFQDVTSSSYQEQDRINVDYDELTGNFSQGSIMTNRKMNETVGGMGMISNAANQITEYTLRTFTETWVEPVLRQLVKMEQKYETDEVILAIAASQAKLIETYGVSEINDELLGQELTLSVNVGMGATNPDQKLGRFMGAMQAYSSVATMELPGLDMKEIGKEVFGLAGYRDGGRFMVDDETNAQIEKVIKGATQMVEEAKAEVMQREQAIQEEGRSLEKMLADVKLQSAKLVADEEAMQARGIAEDESLRLRQELLVTKTNAAANEATAKINAAALQLEAAMSEIMAKLQGVEVPDDGSADGEAGKIAELFAGVAQAQQDALAIFSGALIEQAGKQNDTAASQAAILTAIQKAVELQSRPKIGTLSSGKQIRIESAGM
jgi:hypothetical protein